MSHMGGDTDNHKTRESFIPVNSWGKEIPVSEKLVGDNLEEIKKSIAPCKSRIIGVTKYFGLDAIVNGYKAGLRDFGESRVLEAVKKIQLLPKEIRINSTFHFIGHLQTNKAEKAVEYFDYIHSVDSLKLAKAISLAACRLNKREKVLLQVNNAKEEQKFGYDKQVLKFELSEILELEGLQVVGLMNIAPLGATEIDLKALFADIKKLRDEIQSEFAIELPELSMGMSDDYKIAVGEGATMIRIGRKLFK